ncbi:hypothetical protein B0A49_05385 [Cryomyces minteri]|uniref:RRM domain-containing protein n=1 Tax=Cryomyces minteri TaxID=331657 RepID=A0A4V5NFA9_9PEZI|nr:hypothetical protein B0A49_11282 [Cryomyces minteri]TKA70299.1 hypothetical protein B0A49_05385 [Cryomyces minteri]
MAEVSATRLYLGNLPRNATKGDVEAHFNQHGTGEIMEIKLMNGFGFIEYKDALDARDVVPAFHGSDFMGERLVVQFARGSNRRPDGAHFQERTAPRPRRTQFRMTITGLPAETSWQDLKDFARQSGLDVVYSEIGRERDPNGSGKGFVEYETADDLRTAVEKLDGTEFKGNATQAEIPRPRDRFRSRSPPGGGRRNGYGPPPGDEYYHDRRGPPRGYSPRRDDYRRRTPPPRDYYDSRDRYGRSPPRPRGPVEDYPPPRRPYPDERYDARAPPPGRYEPEPYVNGHGRAYDRPPSPRRPRSPGRGYDAGYERPPRYW